MELQSLGWADFLIHIEEMGMKMARWTVVQFLSQIREFAKKRNKPALKTKKAHNIAGFCFCSGEQNRTADLWVMNPTL